MLDVYFPTKSGEKTTVLYKTEFSSFVDHLTLLVSRITAGMSAQKVSWIICGTDTNAHFAGSGSPPRLKDDWAAKEIRKFMNKFDLVSLADKFCPAHYTRLNTRGHRSCLDTFLVSNGLLKSGAVTMYEVVDWIETGSDHCPIYLRAKVYPAWGRSSKLPTRRILKSSGLRSLRKRLGNPISRASVVSVIKNTFSPLCWTDANDQKDMDRLWSRWVESYRMLVDRVIGTRPARKSSWGRQFDSDVRSRCKQASISRAWYILAHQTGLSTEGPLRRWVKDRKAFIEAWEKSKRDWLATVVTRAVNKGDIAIWKLLNGLSKRTFRPLAKDCGNILTDPKLIVKELYNFHWRSLQEVSSVPSGEFTPVKWEKEFAMDASPQGDLVLSISDDLVLAKVKKMKITTVPDHIFPVVIKLLFGESDSVGPLAELIRAVVRTRRFPNEAKIARQIFLWKGKGEKNCLDNCRTITLAGAILKLCEACVKEAGGRYWAKAGFPCDYWGQFSGAPESLYI